MKSTNIYDLNTLLRIATVGVCLIGIILYWMNGGNQFVDINSLFLLLLLGVQTILMLLYEKRFTDPFIILLSIINIFFYFLRIDCLFLFQSSTVLERFRFDSSDMNYSLIFMMLSNLAIFVGITRARGRTSELRVLWPERQNRQLLSLLIIMFCLLVIKDPLIIPGNLLGRVVNAIRLNILDTSYIVMISVFVVVDSYKIMAISSKITFISMLALLVILSTLGGSKAGIMTMAFLVLISVLSSKRRVVLNKKLLLFCVLLFVISVVNYIQVDYLRKYWYQPLNYEERARILMRGLSPKEILEALEPISQRAGYLDYSADLIVNSEDYSKFINPLYYFKSVIDNGLTPGFDVFDAPDATSAITFVYRGPGIGRVSKRDAAFTMQSNHFSGFAECYVFFGGFAGLFGIFIISYIFKKIYLSIRSRDKYFYYLCRAVTLNFFYLWLISFGLDRMFCDLIHAVINLGFLYLLLKVVFPVKRECIFKARTIW